MDVITKVPLLGSEHVWVIIPIAVIAIIIAMGCLVSSLDGEPDARIVKIVGAIASFLVLVVVAVFPVSSVNTSAVAAMVEDRYELSSVEPSAPLSSKNVERTCQGVHGDSPWYTGVADGQVVKFRVGIADCDDPDVEIEVVSPADITAESLER